MKNQINLDIPSFWSLFYHEFLARLGIISYLCPVKAVPRSVAGAKQAREESPGSIGLPTGESASSW